MYYNCQLPYLILSCNSLAVSKYLQEARREKYKLIQLYKIKNNLTPDYLSSLLPPVHQQQHNYNTRNSKNMVSYHCRTAYYHIYITAYSHSPCEFGMISLKTLKNRNPWHHLRKHCLPTTTRIRSPALTIMSVLVAQKFFTLALGCVVLN